MYLCMCLYIHIYICSSLRRETYHLYGCGECIYIYIHVCVHTYEYVCVYICIDMCACAYICAYIYIYMCDI